MKRSSSMTAIFALGAGSGCVGGVIGRQAIPQPPGADISWQAGVEYGTVAPARKRARCARAEGLQSRAGVPVVPGGGDRLARHVAAGGAGARPALDQLEAV